MSWHLILMIAIYILAGLIHLTKPQIYLRALPPTLQKQPMFWIYVSGFFEILLGVLCFFEDTRAIGLIGIMLMLLTFLWIHFYMIRDSKKFNIPTWVLWLRIPLQWVLMYWAYSYL